jgi:EAL domain-containing protein (putative c-di-GMP-specific phosphodiesterase class I)
MYRAKAGGRGRYEFFAAEMSARALERFELERDLRRALALDELTVHYQPVVPALGLGAMGVEALVRWTHPERGLVGPDAFIPLAEETGLIGRLFDTVLEAACRQLTSWDTTDGGPSFVSVNVAPRQLSEPGLLRSVERTLSAAGLSPERLTLEITEGALVGDAQAAIACLVDVRALGVRVALDDFGAGHASLGHLKALPIDALKIDRSFVAGLGTDEVDRQIVAATINLAHALGLQVVAEGVEVELGLEVVHAGLEDRLAVQADPEADGVRAG